MLLKMNPSTWDALDGLRAILALHVLFIHANLTPGEFTACVSQFSSTTFFIVLSGFSLGRTYAVKDWNIASTLRFYFKRLIRIFPSYLLSQGFLLVYYSASVSKKFQ